MSFDFTRARPLLQKCDLAKLFREELGWEPAHQQLPLREGETDYAFTAIAEKRGFTVWLCESLNGGIPDHATRVKLDRQLSETSFEHLIVFVTADRTNQSWMWVRREQGKPLAARTHDYHRGQPGDSLLQKLESLYVSLEDEEAGLSTVEVAGRARAAFDIEKVTKTFYRDFDAHRKAFLKFIVGIGDVADREWYASVMLNRLMFVYFIQKKGFLDGDRDYLRQRLNRCKKEQGKDKFYSFYRYFLLRLFHEGFGKRRADRAPDLEKLLGNIPYLNGGLFDVHQLELPERYGKSIAISDSAFEAIFEYFDQYQWHLDERPLRADNEINPDVLGYIFEKYINQKQMGAYYTKEDITEYIGKNTVIPFLFDAARAECKVAFENPGGLTVWDYLRENPDRYIYPAVRHGTELTLPTAIAVGLDTAQPDLIERRKPWNKPAPAEFGLPTETWREVVARRLRYEEIRSKIADGEVRKVNDFITLNLDLRQFAQDVILNSEGPDLLRAVWSAIQKVTVLDPTCGSGAFLFAALNILEPLYEICLDRMEAFVADDDRDRPKSLEDTARELIASGESQTLEFKATARWNLRDSKADKTMEQVIVKTVAAFLNSDGGNLLIGVQDDGSISGIEPDHQVVGADKQNRDFYERWLNDLLLRQCGKEHTANLLISFVRLEEMDVCRIAVSRASTAVYIRENDQDKFYVRTGNSTNALTTSEVVAYHQQRFTNATPLAKVLEHSKPSRPKRYADFRKVIDVVAAHPKRSYFVYKSIILNNLFGVDIMEEAVEICKLRLFLKLAAQVEPDAARDNLGIEPLPDVDFNIRAGNTLVGYATYDEVKLAITGGLDFDNAMQNIAVKAADLQQTFDKFRQLQTEGDGSVPSAHKLELQGRLKALEDELNRHLAGEYGVKVSDKAAYAKWVTSHQPFHWFIHFYGILSGGGFDVIVGNPPYVAAAKVRKSYAVKHLVTDNCTDIYAWVLERSQNLLRTSGRTGMIVPLSLGFSGDFDSCRRLLFTSYSHNWFSSFGRIPAALFNFDVRVRNTIHLALKSKQPPEVFTTRLHRWFEAARPALFQSVEYAPFQPALWKHRIPKLNTPALAVAFEKALAPGARTLDSAIFPRATKYVLHFKKSAYNWLNFCREMPPCYEGETRVEHTEFGEIYFPDLATCELALLLANGKLMMIYWFVTGDDFHVTRRNFADFPADLSAISQRQPNDLLARVPELEQAMEVAVQFKLNAGRRVGNYNLAKCRNVTDQSDLILADAIGLSGVWEDIELYYAQTMKTDFSDNDDE